MTRLADSGPGSLRHGIESATGPRTIVFEVGGTIELESDLEVRASQLTLAGQTAPGGGITLAGRETRLDGVEHVVLRYLRFRPGDGAVRSGEYEPDALSVRRSRDVVVDHVSASWAVDEVLSVTHDSHRISVQWSIVAEALHEAGHHKGDHGYGTLADGGDLTFHHNLYAHNRSRNPRPGGLGTRLSFVNNLVYNPGDRFGYAGTDRFAMNYVGNLGVAGPDTQPDTTKLFVGGGPGNRIYQVHNRVDLDRDGRMSGEPARWLHFGGLFTPARERFDLPRVGTQPALDAARQILAGAGASRPRDPVDARIVASVREQTGAHIDSPAETGGLPQLARGEPPRDADRDGMADAWELRACLDPSDPSDRNLDSDADGYTHLEAYLHSLVSSPLPTRGSGEGDAHGGVDAHQDEAVRPPQLEAVP